MYYLETNSLRALLPRLSRPEFRDSSFTSIASMIELVAGIDSQKEFELRKKIIRKVIDSGIAFNFELPEDRFLKAFGLRVIPDHKQFTIDTVNTLLTIDKFIDIEGVLTKASLLEYWNHFKKLDSLGEATLKNSFQGKAKQFKTEFGDGREQHNERWDKDYKEKKIEKFLEPVIKSYAKNISRNSELNPEGLSAEELISAYDGTCNKYMAASNYYADLKVIFGTEPGANDYFDLNHISYIEDDNIVIITDDKMIHKVCSKLFPTQILRTSDV